MGRVLMALKLPRLQRTVALVDAKGYPGLEFHRWFDSYGSNIERAFNDLSSAVAAIAAAQAAADAANAAAAAADAAAAAADAAASTAQTSADAAQSTADAVAAVAKLTNSGVTGATITATDAGADVTVTISAHTRVYGDGTSHAVNGGSVTGLAYSTQYFIYYDDATFAAAAVTYLATTSEATAAQTGARHLVGAVTTPAALGAPLNGLYVDIPGIGNISF